MSRAKRSRGRAPVLTIEWAAFALIMIGAVVLAIGEMRGLGCLWRDEVNGVVTATASSYAEVWRLLEFESAPIGWTLVLRGWSAVAGSTADGVWRTLGGIEGFSVVLAVAFAAWRMGRRPALVGLALVAMNPVVMRWSATIRPWGAAASAAVVTLAVFWDLMSRPARRELIIAAIVAIVSMQMAYQNAVMLAATIAGCVAVAWVRRDLRQAVPPIAIGVVAAVSLVPYVGIIRGRMVWAALGQAPITVAMLGTRVGTIASSAGIVSLIAVIAFVLVAAASLFASGRVLGVEAGGLSRPRGEARALAVYALTASIAATLGLAAFYLTFRYPTQEWYYVGWWTFAAAGVEAIIAASWYKRGFRTAYAIAAIAVVIMGGIPSWNLAHFRLSNVDLVSLRMTQVAAPDDLIVLNSWYAGVSFSWYYGGSAPLLTTPPLSDPRVHRYDLVRAQMLAPSRAMPPLLDRIEQVLRSGHRVFIAGRLPKPARTAELMMLAPPPLGRTAWNAQPYELLWETQLGALLAEHAVTRQVIQLDSYVGFEAYGGWVYFGWKD